MGTFSWVLPTPSHLWHCVTLAMLTHDSRPPSHSGALMGTSDELG